VNGWGVEIKPTEKNRGEDSVDGTSYLGWKAHGDPRETKKTPLWRQGGQREKHIGRTFGAQAGGGIRRVTSPWMRRRKPREQT